MTLALLLPLLVSVALGLTAGPLQRLLPPATTAPLLTASAVLTALATGLVLAVAGFVALGQVPVVAALGHWSRAALGNGGLPAVLGTVAGAAALLLLARALRHTTVALRRLWDAEMACRQLGRGADGLVVTDGALPDAYALPGRTGRIVVSRAMLRALPADERRVLLAHEASHLRHRHHAYTQLADLAAAANPALLPVATAVRASVERWADEDAAAEVQDRSLAARAIAHAGLVRHRSRSESSRPQVALAASATGVVARTQALLAPTPRPRGALVALVASSVLLAVVAAGVAAHDTEDRFELARALVQHAS